MAQGNVKREYNNREIWELLCRIDRQYQPSAEELRLLETREGLLLNDKKIQFLPRSVGLLKSLKRLDLSDNPLTELPEALWTLTGLEVLNLNGTQLRALPEALGALRELRELYLGYVPITELPARIGELNKLELLNLRGSSLRALPEEIGRLSSLQFLHLSDTQLSALPEEIGRLSSLQFLDLSGTQISALPEEFGRLSSLEILELSNTPIRALPERLGELPALRYLYLNGLSLDRIPRSLALKGLPFKDEELSGGTGIYVHGLTLREQKLSVFVETPELIGGLYDEETVVLRECKVIFLGDGGVGKSYTIRRFRNQGKKATQEQPYLTEETHGVELTDYDAERGADSFRIHFWDFGGQEILHSMHRCFLTEETCYVVTIRTRDTDNTPRARYWLRTVQSFAPKSQILLYVNLWGNTTEERALDETVLRKEFPQIQDVIYCSAMEAEDGEFRARVMKPIVELAAASDGCRKEVSAAWERLLRRLKEAQSRAIREHKKNFLTREEYHALCRENGVVDEKAAGLLTLFNNLGVCFSYHRDEETEGKPELADYKLLSPIWLTNALYAIVEEGAAHAQEGVISEESVQAMLHNRAPDWVRNKKYRRTAADIVYEDEECRYVLDVAEHFRLCYRVSPDKLFFPALCQTRSPAESLQAPEGFPLCGTYRFDYEYLPDSVIHKLMIGCLRKGYTIRRCWLKGMDLGRLEHHRAVIRIAEEKTLLLELYGKDEHPLYELLPMLREEILRVNADLNLTAKELIVDGRDAFPVAQLLNTHKLGQEWIVGNDSSEPKRVLDLLERFFDAWTIGNMEAGPEGIRIGRYQYHRANKDDAVFRTALLDAYGEKCEYCGRALVPALMHVDHILATKRKETGDSHVRLYLKELENRGFDLEHPDYIENFFPACPKCNVEKSNETRDAVTLREYHAIALNHTPKVLKQMEKLKKEKAKR